MKDKALQRSARSGCLGGMVRVAIAASLLASFLGGCQLGQPLQVTERGQLTGGRPHLALLPFGVVGNKGEKGVRVEVKAAAERLTRRFRQALDHCPSVFLVAPDVIERAYVPPVTRDEKALIQAVTSLGIRIGVNGVIVGELTTYIEREGGSWGARRPASVAFSVKLLQAQDGATLWEAEFVETQKPLSEDIGSIGRFLKRGGRYLAADELAAAGAEAVAESFCRYLSAG